MKRKVLMVCSSVFQLYVAIALKKNFYFNDDVDLILTDSTPIFKSLIEEKQLYSIFHKINYSEVNKNISDLNRLERSHYFKPLFELFPRYYVKKIWKVEIGQYDEYCFSIYHQFNILLASYLKNQNANIKISMFEDGISTYLIDCSYQYSVNKNRIQNCLSKIYLFEPELLCINTEKELVAIPQIKNDSEVMELMQFTFKGRGNKVKEKFIFFEESFSNDGYTTNDTELINNLYACLNNQDFLLKHHPRNRKDRFQKILPTMDGNIFWEYYFLENPIDDKVLVTISSNTVFTPHIINGSSPYVILLYKLFQGTSPILGSGYFDEYIEKYKKEYPEYARKKIFIPESMNEFYEVVLKLREENL